MSPRRHRSLAAAALAVATLLPLAAQAQEPYLGEIRCFGFNFAPRGWALLDGQLLSISQNSALFSLLGTQFGGDGRTTFALPDLRGRSLLHVGQAPGLALNAVQGQAGGAEQVTLTRDQMPRHTHTVAPLATNDLATATSPGGRVPAAKPTQTLYGEAVNTVAQASTVTSRVGGTTPVPTRSPFLAVTCAIALQGIYPSRE